VKLPANKILAPGVVTHSTPLIEHPELVAQRIRRFTDIVGPDRVIASTDCGLGLRCHPQVAWAKLKALAGRRSPRSVVVSAFRRTSKAGARRESSRRSYSAAPAASRGYSTDKHRGMHRHCSFGTTRIAQNELAAMNRSARFPIRVSSCSDGAAIR
jgi:hypothetical protein